MKRQNGVTIVALVVTVIVLLILAGITISSINGKNGIITNSISAKELTEISNDEEQLQILYVNKAGNDKYGDVEMEDYLDYLEEKGLSTKEKDGKYYAELNGRIYELKMDDDHLAVGFVEKGKIIDPRIQKIEVIDKTLSSVSIKVTALRMDGGTYKYYIGLNKDNLGETVGNNQTGEYTFLNLTQGKTYYIKVVGENPEGLTTEKIISTKIDAIPDATTANIKYTIEWANGTATVKVSSSNSKYNIETSLDNTTYASITTRTGLYSGNVVYARLTNGKYAGKEIAINVIDNTKPELTATEKAVTTKSIEIQAIAKDNESGITESKPYKYYLSNSIDGDLSTPVATNTTGKYKFDNLVQNTTYYIKVEIEDAAGNKQTSTITAKTKLIPAAEQAITRVAEWNSDGTAQVTLSTTEAFTIQYRKDASGTWTTYTNSIAVNNGETIYMCLTDGKNQGEDYALKIEDNEGPKLSLTKQETTTNSITINVEAQDSGSGMPTEPQYNYYIKASNEENYRLVGENITSATYTYTELNSQTTYNMKVTAKDKIGNQGEGTLDATTNEFTYTNGNISFSQATWAEKKASVVITNNTEYHMQYKVIPKGEAISVEGTWNTVETKTTTVENLKDEYTILARLYDGTNVTKGYATCIVEDNTPPQITITGLTTEWQKENIVLSIQAEDNESGLPTQCYSFDGGTTWQAENTKTYEQNTAGIIIKVKDEAGNIATYNTINITNIDKTGPIINVETSTTSNSVIINITSAIDEGIGMENTPTYTYYITTNNAELETMQGEASTQTTKKYEQLTQNTTYYIKVEVQDKLGNVTKVYKTVSTGSLDADSKDLSISAPTWAEKKASVTITNSSKYQMEYQVVKSGETFDINKNWIQTTETEKQITGLLNKDTVYARLTDGTNVGGTIIKEVKDEKAPTITVEGNSTEWTNQNVTLTINAQDLESGLQEQCYSFNGGQTWQAENTKTYEENTEGIVIQVRDIAGNIATYETMAITKIDKTGPNITITEQNTTTKQITVNVTTNDAGVGMGENPTYTYYTKKDGDTEFTKVDETQSTTYTFENLKSGTKYTIKVETKDALNNVGEKTIEITTRNLLYAEGDITFTKTIWSNGIATVTINNNKDEYDMQYQIAENGADIDVNGKWTTLTEKTKDIGKLKEGNIIYARLTDGANVTSNYATCQIDNPAKETYTEEELASNTTRANFDILGISVNSNEIRVQIDAEQQNAYLYNYYYKTINDDKYTLISTNTYYNDPAVITNIKEGATYKIKAVVIDNAGNVTRSENTATTIALEQAATNQTYTNNRTYIDNSKEIDVRTSAGTGSAGTGETTKVQAGYTISLPETFKISETAGETKQTEGTVLKDSSNNEYVWIPVNDAIYDGVTPMPTDTSNAETRKYKPMAMKQSGYTNYYESIIYTFNGSLSYRNTGAGLGKSSFREPSLITNNSGDGYTWNMSSTKGVNYDADSQNYNDIMGFESTEEFGKYLANSYNKMVTAVDSYGGFYIGRYETTTEGTGESMLIGSKPNSKVLSTNNWYKMNLYQDSQKNTNNPFNKTASVTSTMVWGSQWDVMLNYILTGNDKDKVTTRVGEQKNEPSNSAEDETDKVNNIYDLGSNSYEWTQEANGVTTRIYRGNSYDTSILGSASSRRGVIPTDQGPALGSRMALYVQSTNDVTGPATKIIKTTSTSNTITVEATATDKETGVAKYRFSISEDGTTWTLDGESDSNTYTYTGLAQEKTYYLKVEAKDGAGNIGEDAQTTQSTGKLGDVAKTAITKIQKYGVNGSGIIQLQVAEEYKKSGYYIEYQVLEASETLDMNGTWTKGETITKLSNGQIIYATLYDGKNRSTDYYKETVEGLEQYDYYTDENGKTSETETVKYTYNGKTAYIPAGFKVGITETIKNIDEGLVIEDSQGNQFVWVPVENAIETDTSKTSTEKAMARYQSGYSATTEKQYFEGVLYDFSGTSSTKKAASVVLGTNTYREPTLLTSGADYTWNLPKGTAIGTSYDTLENFYKYMTFGSTSGVSVFNSYTEFGQYMNSEYSNMVQSVARYGGFYVGRFETSLSGTAGNKDAVAQSQMEKTPINNQTWYRDYYYQDSNINPKNPYYNTKSVTSSMIWGSQWDAIMNWMLSDDKTKDFVTKVTGNHTEKVSVTGAYTTDLAKNIFDMSANVTEWTQEGQGTYYRNYRGGFCISENDTHGGRPASYRINDWRVPSMTSVYTDNKGNQAYLGTRMALYIKNTEDTTAPTVEVTNTKVGTNNIEVEVDATDAESGVSKYRYSISYNDFQESGFTDDKILQQTETFSGTYSFEQLTQNQVYYIKIEVINGVGKTATCYTGQLKTEVLDVQEGAIVKEKVYGKKGSGTAYFSISSTTNLEKEGYYIQYQVDKTGAGYQANGTWTKGNTVTGLSVGDVVYTRVYDGVNVAEYYLTTNITELETFSEVYTNTTKYEDYDTVKYEDGTEEQVLSGTAYIPAGFKVATSSMTKKIKNGLVIEDKIGNQYVWIPVKNAIYDGKTTLAQSGNSATYKPLARYQSGYSEKTTEQFFEGILYNYSGTRSYVQSTANKLGTSGNREPSLVTNSSANYSWVFTAGNNYDATNYSKLNDLNITSATEMGQYMNNQYTKMVQSVAKYGGFYVGRYETSLYTTSGTNSTSGTVVKSVVGQTPMASVDWYKMYLCEDSNYASNPYKTSTSVTSSMIWGSQWDAMLNYILEGTDRAKVTAITGNHSGSRWSTGQAGNDIMNNIFDLSSNVREWTQEANSSTYRVNRGGLYDTAAIIPSSNRSYNSPTNTYNFIGSRLSLYLQ